MKIWKYTTDSDHYFTLNLTNYKRDSHWLLADNFRTGELFSEPLPQIAVHYETEWRNLSPSQRRLMRQGKLLKGDFPSLTGGEVIFSERALRVLGSLIRDSVQVIPLKCEEDRLYLIHVINFVDCLDHTLSKIQWLSGFENRIIFQVHHYEFHEEKLSGQTIFKIPELFITTFVSDAFKTVVEKHGLKGLVWKPLP